MRKLTRDEEYALRLLEQHNGWCPGTDPYYMSDESTARGRRQFIAVLKSLWKKGRVTVEETQDGPKYHAA